MSYTHHSFRRWQLVALALACTVLFVLKIVQVPEFHKDAQYYVQAALLWPSGQTTFAASWIGARDLVPLMYFLAMQTFGVSLDTMAIALAADYAIFCLVLSLTIIRLVEARSAAVLLIALTWVGAFPLSAWLHPGTEGLGALLEAAIVASFAWGYRSHRGLAPVIALGFTIALSFQVRSELVVLGCLVAQRLLFAKGVGERTIQSRVGFAARLAGVLIVTSLLAQQTWDLWIPTEKPHPYRATFLAHRAIKDFGYGANGPASKRLAELVGVGDHERLPFWKALGRSFRAWGATESDRVIGAAGVEAARRFPADIIRNTVVTLCGEFCGAANLRPVFKMARTTCDERWETQRKVLRELDQMRTRGRYATARTEALAERTIAWVAALRERICGPVLRFSSPFALATISSVLLILLAAAVTGLLRDLSLSLGLYGLALQVLASVTQGPVARYAEATMFIQVVVLLAIVAQALNRLRLPTTLRAIRSGQGRWSRPPDGSPDLTTNHRPAADA